MFYREATVAWPSGLIIMKSKTGSSDYPGNNKGGYLLREALFTSSLGRTTGNHFQTSQALSSLNFLTQTPSQGQDIPRSAWKSKSAEVYHHQAR